MSGSSTTLVCILDGFGLNSKEEGNAVAQARKPNIDRLMRSCPMTTLITHGERVGLPDGQMGNSEVGHLNIGAGREVEQWLLRISRALKGEFLSSSSQWREFVSVAQSSPTIHVIGLYSSGGVHSHLNHLHLLIERLLKESKSEVRLHLFTDGRDVSPNSARDDIEALQQFLSDKPRCKISTICGRFYGMDRDKRWERTKKAYDLIVKGVGASESDPLDFLERSYAEGITDEFIEPGVVNSAPVKEGDSIVFFNFREDRMRQIVRSLVVSDFDGFPREATPVKSQNILCFTDYDHTFHLPFLFEQLEIKNHLGEVVSSHGLRQLRVAETEKYPHVTYFLNGGIEKPYRGEDRVMVPSPRDVKTYDQKPEMSAAEVTQKVIEGISSRQYGLIVVNFANCDMVGHTGDLSAAVKAVETVDNCLGLIIGELEKINGVAVIFADHGNAEQMVNYSDGSPFTAHTTYPVPFIIFGHSTKTLRQGGALCDVAPTVLQIMGISQPKEMTGQSLIAS